MRVQTNLIGMINTKEFKMRVIKFRVWDLVEQDMFPWEALMENPYVLRLALDGCEATQIAMQYTGLKDKNDVEIYEGDILEEENGYYFLVSWNEQRAKFELLWKTKAYQYPEWNRGVDMKVIGNIHENSDLFNVQGSDENGK